VERGSGGGSALQAEGLFNERRRRAERGTGGCSELQAALQRRLFTPGLRAAQWPVWPASAGGGANRRWGNAEIAPAVGTSGSAGSEERGVGQGERQRWSSHLDLDRAGTWEGPGRGAEPQRAGVLRPEGVMSDGRRTGKTAARAGDRIATWAGPFPFLICGWREKNMIFSTPNGREKKGKVRDTEYSTLLR
jgi:hypothetical protein